jgi:Fic family protein
MDIHDFKAGTWEKGYGFKYFVPEKINHEFTCQDSTITALLESASIKLGELNSFARFVPDTNLFISMHVYAEAVISSRIEGTKTQMEEAFLNKNDIDPERRDDWQEVVNYVKAMNQAIHSFKKLPLSSRLIKETHKILLQSVRGKHKTPGEFRTSQNWIGGATPADAVFVPPAHTLVPELISDLEKFLHNDDTHLAHLVRIAIAHYQFETIHPFLDGNGRIGRLLITLYLVYRGILEKPLLYLSDFFEHNKGLYYDNLTRVRTKNDLGQWIRFFLVGVAETAEKGVRTLKSIIDLKEDIERNRIMKLGKRIATGNALLQFLFKSPAIQVKNVAKTLELSPKAAGDLVDKFIELKILKEITGNRRNRFFMFAEYFDLFDKGKGK